MGDMGEIFRAMDACAKDTRDKRHTEAKARAQEVRDEVDTFKVDPNGTWNLKRGEAKIQYYPTKGTWQYKNQMYRGGLDAFIAWLSKL